MPVRLSREDWIAAGLDALAEEGGAGLKADVLAKRLGVSRGSFYWHFADLDAFHGAVVARWREVAVDEVIHALGRADEEGRLRKLMRIAFRADASLEIGMRAWAASSERARAAVTAVDARRLSYMERLLTTAGVGAEASGTRALVIYWTYLGSVLSRSRAEGSRMDGLIDALADFALEGKRA